MADEKMDLIHRVKERHDEIVVIISPARSGSTPLSRVFWEHSAFRYYCHEPFEVTYFDGEPFETAIEKLEEATDLLPLKNKDNGAPGNGLIVKEMPYQVGDNAPYLISLATRPIVFLLRDPLAAVHSRYRKKQEVGDKGTYPGIEMGLTLVENQIAHCKENDIPYVLIESADFRREPGKALGKLFERLDLEFSPALIDWRPLPDFDVDNLEGRHSHLYTRVLQSTGIQPDNAPPRTLEDFPEDDDFRKNVAHHAEIYKKLLEEPQRIRID